MYYQCGRWKISINETQPSLAVCEYQEIFGTHNFPRTLANDGLVTSNGHSDSRYQRLSWEKGLRVEGGSIVQRSTGGVPAKSCDRGNLLPFAALLCAPHQLGTVDSHFTAHECWERAQNLNLRGSIYIHYRDNSHRAAGRSAAGAKACRDVLCLRLWLQINW
ncbi:hypothetical protein BC629DRAFT_1155392 [Irpex lacteus]|nr:hypothetical protein BC629DRAFT_1155392 [Irpex lacteus]